MLICPPALIYLIFCIVQIILDSVNGLYNTALVKTFVAIIIENKKGIKTTVLAIIPTKSFDKLLPNTPDIINPVKGNNNISSNNILRLFAILTISIC